MDFANASGSVKVKAHANALLVRRLLGTFHPNRAFDNTRSNVQLRRCDIFFETSPPTMAAILNSTTGCLRVRAASVKTAAVLTVLLLI